MTDPKNQEGREMLEAVRVVHRPPSGACLLLSECSASASGPHNALLRSSSGRPEAELLQ